MKNNIINFFVIIFILGLVSTKAQVNQLQMDKDAEVAENILKTLIKQDFGIENFFLRDVKSNYISGYGITLYIPQDEDFMIRIKSPLKPLVRMKSKSYNGKKGAYDGSNEESIDLELDDDECCENGHRLRKDSLVDGDEDMKSAEINDEYKHKEIEIYMQDVDDIVRKARTEARIAIDRVRGLRNGHLFIDMDTDSAKSEYKNKFIEISKNFLADYGDVFSQLSPNERIIITNRVAPNQSYSWDGERRMKKNVLSVETTKMDVQKLRQGKITRAQFIDGIKIENDTLLEKEDKDLEVIATLFEKLYSQDVSNTYFVDNRIEYERINDFGAKFYMSVYSSREGRDGEFYIPTQKMKNLSQKERDAKVKEMYPQFEKELKENILDYGRVIKGLKANEQLSFIVEITKCKGCGIPSSIEVHTKFSALNDFNLGKIKRDVALSKIEVSKKGVQ